PTIVDQLPGSSSSWTHAETVYEPVVSTTGPSVAKWSSSPSRWIAVPVPSCPVTHSPVPDAAWSPTLSAAVVPSPSSNSHRPVPVRPGVPGSTGAEPCFAAATTRSLTSLTRAASILSTRRSYVQKPLSSFST